MKINENRSQNISGAKISGRLKDVLEVFDKITINSVPEPALSIYGKADSSNGKTGEMPKPLSHRWILDGMIEAGHGSGTTPSPGNSHNTPSHTPGTIGHISGSVPYVYNQQFNDVMNILNNISYQGNSMRGKLSYTGNDINTSKEELKSAHDTIEEVKNDTEETDVSSKGFDLDRKMTGVEYKLQEGDRYIDSAANDFSTVKSYLNDASGRIDSLRRLLPAGPYQQVISYLDQAKNHINNPLSNTSSVEWDLYNTDSYMKSAAGDIGYARSYIRTIEGDYAGNSVSSEGYSVESYVNSADNALDSAKSELSGTTDSYLPSLRSEVDQAISSLKYAQSLYNSIR
jgi:hypothetical protein